MQNAADLNQALQNLQRETTNDIEKAATEEKQKKHLEEEIFKAEQGIKNRDELIREEEMKITKMRQDDALEKKKIDDSKRLITKLTQEINSLRMESQRNNSKLAEIAREYKEAVASIARKS